MSETKTTPAKYIFLDVVSFTHNRSVEAQTDIVHSLNQIVDASLTEQGMDKEKIIFLPTGDGICIALLNIEDPFDIHLQIALGIIKGIHEYNQATEDEMRKFQVRIGINANTDNLVTDINGKPNIAGAGINMAARVMSKADGNQILVGESVYDTLRYREKYMKAFTGFNAEVKHGVQMRVYQYILNEVNGLNIETPESFKPQDLPVKVEEKFPKKIAYYIAYLIKYRGLLIEKKEHGAHRTRLKNIFWLLSGDMVTKSESSETEAPLFFTYNFGQATIEEQLDYYLNINIHLILAFDNEINLSLYPFAKYFEDFPTLIFVNLSGREKLKSEWEEIWNEFELDNYV